MQRTYSTNSPTANGLTANGLQPIHSPEEVVLEQQTGPSDASSVEEHVALEFKKLCVEVLKRTREPLHGDLQSINNTHPTIQNKKQ